MKKAKKLSKKDIDKHLQAAKKAITAGKTVTINRDSVINVPIAGVFRDYISEALNYLFTLENEEKIMQILAHIRTGFKDVPKDAPYDPYMNSIWTLMTLVSEINHQAAEQGHTIITDEPYDETVSNLINSFVAGTEKDTKNLYDDAKISYEKTRAEAEKNWEGEAKALLDKEIKKDKTTNDKKESKTSNED
jgi:hypothetical protein